MINIKEVTLTHYKNKKQEVRKTFQIKIIYIKNPKKNEMTKYIIFDVIRTMKSGKM
jgi:hypothetical protein